MQGCRDRRRRRLASGRKQAPRKTARQSVAGNSATLSSDIRTVTRDR